MSASISSSINGLFVGKAENRWEGRAPSAIGKSLVPGPQEIDQFGFL
ncbi:hypothetical protein [Tateyamaria omphalii]|nr:hypothetical protein [Tateyamaria omphalii]